MSAEQNKAVVRRWFDAINQKDLLACERVADETYAPDFILHDPTMREDPNAKPGPAGAKVFVRQLISDYPDLHLTIDDMIAEGDKVVFRFSMHGTHVTDRKPVSLTLLSIMRFAGSQFAEEWELGAPGEW
jgi:ketosteroid isomerase-like protein